MIIIFQNSNVPAPNEATNTSREAMPLSKRVNPATPNQVPYIARAERVKTFRLSEVIRIVFSIGDDDEADFCFSCMRTTPPAIENFLLGLVYPT